MATPKKGSSRTLVQYARAKRREGCPCCALPADVLQQLQEARGKKIPRAVMLDWLRNEVGVKITDDQLNVHAQGRHDAENL